MAGAVIAGPSFGDERIAPDLSFIESDARIRRGFLPINGTFQLIANTAYFVFMGRTVRQCLVQNVYFQVTTLAGGASPCEVGIFSSPASPNINDQTLTKIEATGTVTTLASTGKKTNTSAFTTEVAAGTYLWAGLRANTAGAQPICTGLVGDMFQGYALSLAAAGALTSSTTFAAVRTAITAATTHPELMVRMNTP